MMPQPPERPISTSQPILVTKLGAPPIPPGLVIRRRLIERLDAGLAGKLTLVTAPPGFGKTTLLSDWARGRARPVAWLSLDPGDNDPARFWSYVIHALSRIYPSIGDHLLDLIGPSLVPSRDALLVQLINALAAAPTETILVLDDYQVIESAPIHDALGSIIEHLPPTAHLVIVSRADPPFPLGRLRARGQPTELRDADLRFTPQEAALFLREAMGLTLSPDDITALENRTEGWIAGLQLAALSLRGHDRPSEFVRAFAGNHRYVFDYLLEEVLNRQPPETESFLLETSILDRLSGSLCNAVTQ
ncbi:MAG TPA: hypothetical protein VFL82_14655, partial [Thermomicrobiales bacterium]|nr:hypothetical protein [Thermomicrobiales bacterium]